MRFFLIPALAAAAVLNYGQDNRPAADAPQTTIRSTSQEVLLDVVVRGKNGRPVKNLTVQDFDLTDDGQHQAIRAFRLVTRSEDAAESPAVAAPAAAGGTTVKPAIVRPIVIDPLRQIRVITLAFDRLSLDSNNNARKAAEELLKTETGPNLFFGVFIIDQSVLVLQPYTMDRDLVQKAVAKATQSTSALYKSEEDSIVAPADTTSSPATSTGSPGPTGGAEAQNIFAQMIHDMQQFNEDVERPLRSRATLIALEQLIQPQYRLPGRKTVLYFCEGLQIEADYREEFQALISNANKANVTVYGIDARSLNSLSPTQGARTGLTASAAASQAQVTMRSGPITRDMAKVGDHAEMAVRANVQLSLQELSDKTGGFMIANTNDLRPGLHRVTEDIDTHYELAYSPDIRVFDGRFRTVAVTVKRPGVTVQTRNGYYALPLIPGQTVMPYEVPMLSALAGASLPREIPFRSAGLHFKSSTGDPLGTVVIDVPLEGVTFTTDQATGAYRTHFSVLTLFKDAEGSVIRKLSQDIPRQGPLDKLNAFKKGHFIYTQFTRLPPGRYTMETAVTDRQTGKVSARKSSVLIPSAASELGISSMVPVRSISAKSPDGASAEDPFQAGANKISPEIGQSVKAGGGSRQSLFFTVYVAPGTQAAPDLSLEFFLDGKRVGHGEPKLPAPDARGLIPYIATTPLDSFAAGQYEVRVTVSQDGKTAMERTLLTIE